MADRPQSAPPELPGFDVLRPIGGGGFADVFLYGQRRPARQVAVKVLRSEHISDEGISQFETEADVMAEVSEHPYIVTVYSAGVAPDGRPYIVMEHYPQPHFGIRGRGGKLPVSEVLRVGVQIASAVTTAHQASIIHRDIKPANILTSSFGRPGLTDFGISGVRRDGVLAAASAVTIPFAPPEVLIDEDGAGSEVSDIYSLAATIYSLLAGRPPHWIPGGDNSDASLVNRTTAGSIPRTGRDDAGPLEHLLGSAMARDPSHRPPTALAFARALQDVEQQLQLPATPIEVRGDVSVGPSVDRSDEAGTRRRPQVVRPEGPAAVPPAPSAPADPPTDPIATGPTATGPGDRVDADTVHRAPRPGTAAINDPATADEVRPPTAVTMPAPPRRPPLPVLVGGAVAALVIVIVLVASITGGSDAVRDDVAAATTTPETRPTDLVPVSLSTPTGLASTWDPSTGTLEISWDESPDAIRYPITYRIHPVDPATATIDDDPDLTETFRPLLDVDTTTVTLTDVAIPDGEEPPCVAVYAVGPGRSGSDLSPPACPSLAGG